MWQSCWLLHTLNAFGAKSPACVAPPLEIRAVSCMGVMGRGWMFGCVLALHFASLPSLVLRAPFVRPHRSAHPLRAAICCAEPAEMKLKEIKAELDELGVSWKGVCFERDDMVRALVDARARGPAPAEATSQTAEPEAQPAAATAEPAAAAAAAADETAAAAAEPAAPAADDSAAYEAAYGPAFEAAMKLKVKELRAELAGRNIGWGDAVEKVCLCQPPAHGASLRD